MSHAVVAVTALAMVATLSVVSCSGSKPRVQDEWPDFPKPTGTIHINFSCEGVPTVGLTDDKGVPAWKYAVSKKDPLNWEVAPNVTINAMTAKQGGEPLPFEPTSDAGGTRGKPYKAKVKKEAMEKHQYTYSIEATCQPTSGAPVHLILDPDMIIL